MSRYQVAYRATDKEAVIQAYGDATISGHANIGDFYHRGDGNDVFNDAPESHTLYQHVQDLLYKVGEQNMQSVKIVFKRLTGIAVTPASVTKAAAQTQQISTTFTPADASNRKLIYTSSNPDVATVDNAGLITAVATGNADITVASEDGGFTGHVAFTVS